MLEEALVDESNYEALSYVWGDTSDLKAISLHDCIHHVTTNLETALRHLRSEEADRVLWVDALCINQQDLDLDERQDQVQKMYSIYKALRRVVSRTGEATDDSHIAIKLIQELFADGRLAKNRGIIMCGKDIVERKYYDYTGGTLMSMNRSSRGSTINGGGWGSS